MILSRQIFALGIWVSVPAFGRCIAFPEGRVHCSRSWILSTLFLVFSSHWLDIGSYWKIGLRPRIKIVGIRFHLFGRPEIQTIMKHLFAMSRTSHFLSSLMNNSGSSFPPTALSRHFIHSQLHKSLSVQTLRKSNHNPFTLTPNKFVMINFSNPRYVPCTFVTHQADIQFYK